jgi:hypothetical protein
LKVKELWTVIASRFSVEVENKLETVGMPECLMRQQKVLMRV